MTKEKPINEPIRKECGDCFYNYQCNGGCATDPKDCPYLKIKEEEKNENN
jgi:radical SAM protein with 4Fe4S-binding SPASM domain